MCRNMFQELTRSPCSEWRESVVTSGTTSDAPKANRSRASQKSDLSPVQELYFNPSYQTYTFFISYFLLIFLK